MARAAGVAPSTASLVFSGARPVAEATRARVLAAAASIGYAGPDPRAASLRRGRSGIVGVVVGQPLGDVFVDPVNRLMMDGLAEALAPLGAGLLLLRGTADAADDALTTAPVDAMVLLGCGPLPNDPLAVLRTRGVPVVVVEGDAGPEVPQVLLDDRIAQRTAALHLKALGHERVAICALQFGDEHEQGRGNERVGWAGERMPRIPVTRERLAGAHEVFRDAPVFIAAASRIDAGVEAGRAIIAGFEAHGGQGGRPTAIIAQSDLLAAGIVRAAEAAGLRVPEDLSVTGFDGVEVDGFAPRRLTTLVQPAGEKGRVAGYAVRRMLGGEAAASVTLSCVFRDGDTTGAARLPLH